MDQNDELSEAMTLLTHVWRCARRVKPFSDRRFSSAMHDALELAITSGIKFNKEDYAEIESSFKVGSGYFITHYLSFGDGFYTKAVIARNMSACHAFEYGRGRKPFIVDNVDHPYYHVSGVFDGTRPRDRLVIGSKFYWQGTRVTVTSFDDKHERMVCCSYKERERDDRGFSTGPLKVERMFKIGHKDIKAGKDLKEE